MREHHKKRFSRFCKCGKEMFMDSKGWHCPDDKRKIKTRKKDCEDCVLGKTELQAYKRGKLATLREVYDDFEKWINHEEGYEAGFREIIKAKINEAEK